ncbi:STAS domain-containing protein [Saccharopolyspora sp. HNM0986]|uniref:STAS domain-containing protein n=1 Tax=Saccharopolyspora galaxeae TaxID=2781241 RepID=UPI00190A9A2D|nr:STAS domain-containing protein [Saccharopolyspora sp. HNM0986]MBK0866935.1 STAS domain-containing protein [Saccharopolyspora sp. HNM0986]
MRVAQSPPFPEETHIGDVDFTVPAARGISPVPTQEHAEQASAQGLSIDVTRPDPGTIVLSARGEIDSHTVQRLHELMWHRLASCSEVVVLDLSAITYCNTSGLRLLEQCRLRAEERDISLRVVPDRYGLLARLLDITGTRERFALRANAVTAAHAE